jgi:hypothetical protein
LFGCARMERFAYANGCVIEVSFPCSNCGQGECSDPLRFLFMSDSPCAAVSNQWMSSWRCTLLASKSLRVREKDGRCSMPQRVPNFVCHKTDAESRCQPSFLSESACELSCRWTCSIAESPARRAGRVTGPLESLARCGRAVPAPLRWLVCRRRQDCVGLCLIMDRSGQARVKFKFGTGTSGQTASV